jgi:predicted RNA-binding Zn ribbon-like protein
MPLSKSRAALSTGSLAPPIERQTAGRPPAPGELALVQAFVNSRWDSDRGYRDRFTDPQSLRRWLVEHQLSEPGARLGPAALRRAIEVREGLRQLLFVNNGHPAEQGAVARLNVVLRDAGASVRLSEADRPEFVAVRSGLDGALAVIAVIVAAAQLDGTWSRLKACPGRDCGWVFYDRSRNRSSGWCSMSVCGQREKARTYRARKRK